MHWFFGGITEIYGWRTEGEYSWIDEETCGRWDRCERYWKALSWVAGKGWRSLSKREFLREFLKTSPIRQLSLLQCRSSAQAVSYWIIRINTMNNTNTSIRYVRPKDLATHLSVSISTIWRYAKRPDWICPYISRHLLSLNPLLARCRRYSRGER